MEFTLPPPGSTSHFMLYLGAWMVGASAAAYVAFGVDKRRAESGMWRVPERTLLWIAGLGGWPGAKLAQWRLRHKSLRQPFVGLLNAIALMQFLLIVMALLPQGSLIPVVNVVASAIVGEDVNLSDGKPKGRIFGPKVDEALKVEALAH